jgi:hypothetical protein
MQSVVPVDVGALYAQHRAFLAFVIGKVIWHHLPESDLQDLQQDILLTLHARKYLDRCRTYEQRCQAEGKPYSLLASLRTFVERMAKNYLRNRHAQMRDPVLCVELPGTTSSKRHTAEHTPTMTPPALRTRATQEDAALASAQLSRIRTRLASGRRVIGGAAAVEVFDAATAEGYEALNKYARRQLRRAVYEGDHVAC